MAGGGYNHSALNSALNAVIDSVIDSAIQLCRDAVPTLPSKAEPRGVSGWRLGEAGRQRPTRDGQPYQEAALS